MSDQAEHIFTATYRFRQFYEKYLLRRTLIPVTGNCRFFFQNIRVY